MSRIRCKNINFQKKNRTEVHKKALTYKVTQITPAKPQK